MEKKIDIYDKGVLIGETIIPEMDDLIAVMACENEDGEALYIMCVDGMDYGIVVPRAIFNRVNEANRNES